MRKSQSTTSCRLGKPYSGAQSKRLLTLKEEKKSKIYEQFRNDVRSLRLKQLNEPPRFLLKCFFNGNAYEPPTKSDPCLGYGLPNDNGPFIYGPILILFQHFAKFADDSHRHKGFDSMKHDVTTMRVQEMMYFCEHMGLFHDDILTKCEAVYLYGWVLRSIPDKVFELEDFIEFLARVALTIFSRPPLAENTIRSPTEKIDAFVKWFGLHDIPHAKDMVEKAKSRFDYFEEEELFLRKGHGLAQGNAYVILDGEMRRTEEIITDVDKKSLLQCVYRHPEAIFKPYRGSFIDCAIVCPSKRTYTYKLSLSNVLRKPVTMDLEEVETSFFEFPNQKVRVLPCMKKSISFQIATQLQEGEYMTTLRVKITAPDGVETRIIPVYIRAVENPGLNDGQPATCPITEWNFLKAKQKRRSEEFHKTKSPTKLFFTMIHDSTK